jgi:hypothetical protein
MGGEVNRGGKFGSTKPCLEARKFRPSFQTAAHLHNVRTFGYQAERAVALIYAHFKKEFGFPDKQ